MANCDNCGRVVFAHQGKCVCGWKIPVPKVARPIMPQKDYDQNEMDRAFTKRLREVEAHIAEYRVKNQGATKREACFDYLNRHNIKLPAYVAAQEADEERLAIQSEKPLSQEDSWEIPF